MGINMPMRSTQRAYSFLSSFIRLFNCQCNYRFRFRTTFNCFTRLYHYRLELVKWFL